MGIPPVTLEHLRHVASPPSVPSGVRSLQQWQQVEACFGIKLPEDYNVLVNTIGPGQFAEFITIFTPFARNVYANLLSQPDLNLSAYRAVRAEFPEAGPHPRIPRAGCLLPWGQTGDGNVLYRLTEGPSNTWP
jgi:hypothetical protein